MSISDEVEAMENPKPWDLVVTGIQSSEEYYRTVDKFPGMFVVTACYKGNPQYQMIISEKELPFFTPAVKADIPAQSKGDNKTKKRS